MLFLSELKEKINGIKVSGEDPKIVTRNRVGKEGVITFGVDPITGKKDIKYVERDGVEISYDKENGILFIDSQLLSIRVIGITKVLFFQQ